MLRDSIVILTTDHGFCHGEHGLMGKALIGPKSTQFVALYEEIARIPLIVHFPGCEARREQALVQPPDLMPTFLDIAHAPDPGTMHGRSFLPLLEGRSVPWRDIAITSPTLIHGAGGGRRVTVTTQEWSFICAGNPRITTHEAIQTRAVDGLPKREDSGPTLPSELYHLPTDPSQSRDLIAQHAPVADELRRRLVSFLQELGTDADRIDPWR